MPDEVMAAAAALRRALAGLDPAGLGGAGCARLVEALAVTEKMCAAARAAAAARAVALGAHRGRGYADGVDWLARHSGTTAGEARQALHTATAVAACPATGAALAAGQVSLAEAAEIARAQAQGAGAETELLALARRCGLGALKDQARRRVLAAADPEDLYRRHQAARSFRHWQDPTGMIRFAGALAPHIGVALMNRVDTECDRLRRAHRHDQPPEPREAHAADAVAALLAGTGPARAVRAELVIVADLGAYRRGHLHPGETCHTIGGAPLPPDRARQLAAQHDPFLKAVLHDGTRIDTIAHYGRHIPALLRSALDLGAAPHFDGAQCVNLDCARRHGLQYDHQNPVANHGPTSYQNLNARCWPHHQEKTEQDRQAGLLGPNPP